MPLAVNGKSVGSVLLDLLSFPVTHLSQVKCLGDSECWGKKVPLSKLLFILGLASVERAGPLAGQAEYQTLPPAALLEHVGHRLESASYSQFSLLFRRI